MFDHDGMNMSADFDLDEVNSRIRRMISEAKSATVNPWNNEPFNNKITTLKNWIISPAVVKSPCKNKTLAINDSTFGRPYLSLFN
jgi:hypothetical protein